MKERLQTENNECSRNNKSKSFGKINYLLIYSVKIGRVQIWKLGNKRGIYRKEKNWDNYKKYSSKFNSLLCKLIVYQLDSKWYWQSKQLHCTEEIDQEPVPKILRPDGFTEKFQDAIKDQITLKIIQLFQHIKQGRKSPTSL